MRLFAMMRPDADGCAAGVQSLERLQMDRGGHPVFALRADACRGWRIIGLFSDARDRTDRALRIGRQAQATPLHECCIQQEEAPEQRLSQSGQDLDRLGCLYAADDADHRASTPLVEQVSSMPPSRG